MRAVREREQCGIRRFWIEVDVATLQERCGEFADDDRLVEHVEELLDDVIAGL